MAAELILERTGIVYYDIQLVVLHSLRTIRTLLVQALFLRPILYRQDETIRPIHTPNDARFYAA